MSPSRAQQTMGRIRLSSATSGTKAIAIREAGLEDAESVSLLCTQLGYPSTGEQVRCRLGEILADGQHALLVAECPGGEVIGFVQIHVRKLVVVDRHAEVVGLVVDLAHRAQQLGRRLLEEAEAWAIAQGCGAVRVRSNVVRTDAHGFYENLGYELIKTQRAYRKALLTPDRGDKRDA